MQRVFVLGVTGKRLMPCHPARARQLLRAGRARVVRSRPFTIEMTDRAEGAVQPVRLKIDPGARVTGIALVAEGETGARVVWAGELAHRSDAIRKALANRRAYRRARRGRKRRNRAPRFNNRRRAPGWLAPSLQHRVDTTRAWAERLMARAPVNAVDAETVRFDVHALAAGRPLSGVAYQQGTLHGTELREYLLHRDGHTCVYCRGESGDPVLEMDHVQPRSRGGSNRASNLVTSCTTCNGAKNTLTAGEWAAALTGGRSQLNRTRAERARKVDAGWRPGLRDAAAMNACRYAIGRVLKETGLPVTFASGGRTKYNRSAQGYPKAHWIDATCVGESGEQVKLNPGASVLRIEARGRGRRQVSRVDRFGFPRSAAGRVKRVHGFQTGDVVRLDQPRGKYRGRHVGALAGIRSRGTMDIRTATGQKISASHQNMRLLRRFDGYQYTEARAC